ncbi:root hair specific 4 [Rhynchospora pubera]|uniref:Root hair specific 4 n=2 Tax=Rhynchospora pubera TaxID=906938 RepID=A0AAV8EYA2_9POAL|nr:root hair specific 4 [Rhynchospora pubera]
MQSPTEEEAPDLSQEEEEEEEDVVPNPNNDTKEEVQEEVRVKEEKIEEQDQVDEKDGHDYSKSPCSSAYYSTLSSFDNENEKRIPVDPISLTEFGMFEEDGPLSMPAVFTEVTVHSPILPPVRTPRFVSASLPCSATSSPHYSFSSNQRWDEPNLQPSSAQSPRTLARQHSLALTRFASTRSMSFAEGRTSAHNDTFQVLGITRQNSSDRSPGSSSSTSSESPKPRPKTKSIKEDDFKCGALCMYLPSFSKKKAMNLRQQAAHANGGVCVSRLASLEKFECGSWSPPNGNACDMDMPVEMERSSTHDTESPIRTAFLFEGVEKRGILKKGSSRFGSAKSLGSSNRHVRFSVANSPVASCPSSPSVSSACLSPRLRKVREEFSAFLEAAQSA